VIPVPRNAWLRASSAVSTGVLSLFNDVLGTAHGVRRIHIESVADDEPVEKRAQRRQMLLHHWLGMGRLQPFDESRDVNRLHRAEIEQPAPLIGPPCVFVANIRREDFPESF
jgi:hypothetical protein